MSIFLDNQPDAAAVTSALSRESVGAILLAEFQFASGTKYITNMMGRFIDPLWGRTWLGYGALVGVSSISVDDDSIPGAIKYTLNVPREVSGEAVSPGDIPALMGDRSEYVNRPVKLWLQIIDKGDLDVHGRPRPVGIPSALNVSLMDRASSSWRVGSAQITLTAESVLARERMAPNGRYTDRDQRLRHPSDRGLRYITEVLNTTVRWTEW